MAYTPYYPGGWQAGEAGETPVTPAALNNMEDGIGAALTADDVDVNPTSGSAGPVSSGGVFSALSFGKILDCSISVESFADNVPAGTFQYFRMLNSEPSIYWNYSVGFVFAPSSTEKVIVLFARSAYGIAMKAKWGGTWTNWYTVALQ